jgi:hypothetical protein
VKEASFKFLDIAKGDGLWMDERKGEAKVK